MTLESWCNYTLFYSYLNSLEKGKEKKTQKVSEGLKCALLFIMSLLQRHKDREGKSLVRKGYKKIYVENVLEDILNVPMLGSRSQQWDTGYPLCLL